MGESAPFRVPICDIVYRHVVYKQGKVFKLKLQRKRVLPPPVKGRTIKGYSAASRKRFLELIGKIAWEKITSALLITVTYPDDYIADAVTRRNTHKYLFTRHLERYTRQQLFGLWRLEWKERLTGRYKGIACPHWHFLLFGCPWIDHRRVRLYWRKATGIDGVVCTDVRGAESPSQCAVYAAKYQAKFSGDSSLDYPPNLNSVGRQWGYVRREMIPMESRFYVHNLNEDEIIFLMGRALEVLPWRRSDDDEGFTILGDAAVEMWDDFWVRHIDRVG